MKFKLKGIKIGKNEWVSFILTMIATLFGAFIAIWLTNASIESKEKEDTIKILHTTKSVLSNTFEYSKELNNAVLKFEKDTVNYTEERIESIKLNNPIPYPDLLRTIISNELITKNVSESSHSSIFNDLINLRKLAKYETAHYYQKTLEEMMLQVELEIALLEGEIDLNELESKVEIGKEVIDNRYSTENIMEIDSE